MRIMPPAIPRIPEMNDVTSTETARMASVRKAGMEPRNLARRHRHALTVSAAAKERKGAGRGDPEERVHQHRVHGSIRDEPGEDRGEPVEVGDVERDAEGGAQHGRETPRRFGYEARE